VHKGKGLPEKSCLPRGEWHSSPRTRKKTISGWKGGAGVYDKVCEKNEEVGSSTERRRWLQEKCLKGGI